MFHSTTIPPFGIRQSIGGELDPTNREGRAFDHVRPQSWENDSYSTQLTVNEQPGPRSRLLGFLGIIGLKNLVLLPHMILLMFVGLAAAIAVWVGYLAILFTGKLPEGIYNFTLGTVRWGNRLTAWSFSLTDEYPPFSLST